MVHHPANKPALRHIDRRNHFCCKHVELDDVSTAFTPTPDMVADLKTKQTTPDSRSPLNLPPPYFELAAHTSTDSAHCQHPPHPVKRWMTVGTSVRATHMEGGHTGRIRGEDSVLAVRHTAGLLHTEGGHTGLVPGEFVQGIYTQHHAVSCGVAWFSAGTTDIDPVLPLAKCGVPVTDRRGPGSSSLLLWQFDTLESSDDDVFYLF